MYTIRGDLMRSASHSEASVSQFELSTLCVCVWGVCCAAAVFAVHTPLLDVTRLSSSVTHNGLKVANLSKGSSSDPTSLECFLFYIFTL